MKPRFNVFKDKRGFWRFNLQAKNGKIILQSEAYTRRTGAYNGIEAVVKCALKADVNVIEN